MTLRINNFEIAMKYPEMLAECLNKALQYKNSEIELDASERLPSDWLEWRMWVLFSENSKMLIGVIQRKHGSPYEFHS